MGIWDCYEYLTRERSFWARRWRKEKAPNQDQLEEQDHMDRTFAPVEPGKRERGKCTDGKRKDGKYQVVLGDRPGAVLGKPPGTTIVFDYPCRTLADMTEEEIQDLERQYGCPVKRPK